jgi:FeS assembly protein IscX
MTETLNWESTFAIALALQAAHPDIDLTNISLNMIYDWTLALENFEDERELANDEILSAIYQDWFEHLNPIE